MSGFQLKDSVVNPSDTPESSLISVDVGDATATLIPTQVTRGIMRSTPAIGITLTLPTASSLISYDSKNAKVGFGRHIYICNDGVDVITVDAGDGGTLNGSSTVAASAYSGHYYIRYTNVTKGSEAYTVDRL